MKLKHSNRQHVCTVAGLAASLWLVMPASVAQSASNSSSARQIAVDADPSVFTLGTVSVYGIRETAAEKTETVVDRDEINLLEKKDIGTALSLVPGVFYNRAQGGRYESNVLVRGYDLRSVPIFLDGIPVSIPYDGYSDLGRFTTADVSSVHVAKGYSSVMYGHNTLGGAINIVTLRPRSALDVSATAGIASGGTSELSANVGTMQENWYVQAGVSNYTRDYTRLAEPYVGKDADGNMVDSDRYNYRTRDRRGSVRIGYVPNATDEYVLSYAKQEATKKPGGDSDDGFSPTVWQWPQWDRETVSFVSNTRFLDNKFYVKPRIYYDTFKNTMDWWRGLPQGSHYDDKAMGASIELGTEIIDKHLLKAMFSVKDEQHRDFTTDIYTGDKLASSDKKVKQKFYSVALEDTYSINPNWEMQVGAIYTRRTVNADAMGENVSNLIGQYPQAGSMLSPSIDTFDPQIALFYKPSTSDTFRASISKKTRFPSFKQVYSNYAAGSTAKCPAGSTTCTPGASVPALALQNPGLSPEKALHYELGYQGNPVRGLYLEGSVFYSRSKDAISRTSQDFTTFPGYAITQSINLDGITERKGLDLGLHYDVLPGLGLGLSYSYLHIKNKDDPDFRFVGIPSHFGVAYAEIRANNWIKAIPSVEFRGSSYYDTAGEHKNPGYALANLKLSLTPPAWKHVAINVGVENLFNKNYNAYDDLYASPGRAYYLNVRVDYH